MRALLSVANREGISAFARELLAPRRAALRHGRHARAPRGGRHRGRVRLRPDGGAAARRRPGPHVPPRDLRRDPRPPRRPRAAPAARRPRPRADRPRRRQRQAVRARGRPRPHRHRRGDRDDRRGRRGAPRRRRAQRGRRGRGLRPGALRPRPRRAADARPGLGRHALQARGRRVQHGRRLLRGDRGLPQPDRRQRLPQAPRDGAREGRRPPVRREPAPAGGVLPRDDAPLRARSPTPPSSTARSRPSTTCSTSTPPTGSRRTTRPRRS